MKVFIKENDFVIPGDDGRYRDIAFKLIDGDWVWIAQFIDGYGEQNIGIDAAKIDQFIAALMVLKSLYDESTKESYEATY